MPKNPQSPNCQRVQLQPEDYIAINKIVQPMRNYPKWVVGIGLGFATFVPLITLLFGAPRFITIITFVFGGIIAGLGYWAITTMLRKIEEDVRAGHKMEVIGLLEDTFTRSSGGTTGGNSSSTTFYWRIAGHDYLLDKEHYENALPGYTVRLCYLPTSELTFAAGTHWEGKEV
jgi:hypothetical protein